MTKGFYNRTNYVISFIGLTPFVGNTFLCRVTKIFGTGSGGTLELWKFKFSSWYQLLKMYIQFNKTYFSSISM